MPSRRRLFTHADDAARKDKNREESLARGIMGASETPTRGSSDRARPHSSVPCWTNGLSSANELRWQAPSRFARAATARKKGGTKKGKRIKAGPKAFKSQRRRRHKAETVRTGVKVRRKRAQMDLPLFLFFYETANNTSRLRCTALFTGQHNTGPARRGRPVGSGGCGGDPGYAAGAFVAQMRAARGLGWCALAG